MPGIWQQFLKCFREDLLGGKTGFNDEISTIYVKTPAFDRFFDECSINDNY